MMQGLLNRHVSADGTLALANTSLKSFGPRGTFRARRRLSHAFASRDKIESHKIPEADPARQGRAEDSGPAR
jgi:hypothetical protein